MIWLVLSFCRTMGSKGVLCSDAISSGFLPVQQRPGRLPLVRNNQKNLAHRNARNRSRASQDCGLWCLPRGHGNAWDVEARDFKIEYRSVDGHPDRFPKLAQELVGQNVDLITTRGTPA